MNLRLLEVEGPNLNVTVFRLSRDGLKPGTEFPCVQWDE